MLRFLPLKVGRLYRCLKLLLVVGLFVILLMNTHSLFASFQKNELTDRRFINLNKCPACFGTSWCRKFMNGQVSFETWGRLRFLDVFNVKNVYFAQYGEPREGTRRVVLKRLGSNQELAEIDQKICKRATGRPRCDLIQAMYKTEFARINGDVRLLTPEVVEGWSDLVHCPSQRLLDRVVRRYAETKDSGSFLLKNLKDTERMQLLMTLAFNPEPLVLQVTSVLTLRCLVTPSLIDILWVRYIQTANLWSQVLLIRLLDLLRRRWRIHEYKSFPSDEGWPFAKYLGACGRMVAVNYVGEELWSFYNAPWEKRVDLARQLMDIAEQLTNNDFEFALYLLDVSFDNFAVGPRDGKVIVVDAENVLVADKRLIKQNKPENFDVWYESRSRNSLCTRVTVDHNYYAVCQNLLSRYATWRGTTGGLLHDPPAHIAKDGQLESLLDECTRPKKRYGRFQAAKELREYLTQLAASSSSVTARETVLFISELSRSRFSYVMSLAPLCAVGGSCIRKWWAAIRGSGERGSGTHATLDSSYRKPEYPSNKGSDVAPTTSPPELLFYNI
ncbi:hypothetical protein KUCAC02_017363, partial [Chaenocephalus aceratus]